MTTKPYECDACAESLSGILEIIQHDCDPVPLTAESLSDGERDTLMYVETRVVDHGGKLSGEQMNYADHQTLKLFTAAGLVEVGEARRSPDDPRENIRQVERFADEAWTIVRDSRQMRAASRNDFPVGAD